MNIIIKLFVLLMVFFQTNSVMAAEDIVGTWQGKLVAGPDNELTLQFIISQDADGSYTAVLNSPDEGAIKNVKANSVVYDAGVLKMDVTEFSGSYEGIVKDGKIDGTWKQEGASMPLSLKLHEKLTSSEKDKLYGEWHGQIAIPEGSLMFVFHFETMEDGEFVGFVDLPYIGVFGMPVTEIEKSDGNIILKISTLQAEYEGKFSDNEIVGEYIEIGKKTPLTLKKGEYSESAIGLNLPKEDIKILLGEWHGELSIPPGPINVVFRFEMTENDELIGYHDSPDEGVMGIPITEANMSGETLTLKIKSLLAEIKGQLSGNKFMGNFIQGGVAIPLSLVKGEYKPRINKLNLSNEDMRLLLGKWNGKIGFLKMIFRFETSESGDFIAFIDRPNEGAKGIPVTDANFTEGKLRIKVKGINAEFIGQLSGSMLEGTWTQRGTSKPLSLAKEKP